MTGTYDFRLVALSYLVAVFASYTALDLAGRVTAARGRARLIWLGGGAIAMGVGIWSMHFTGMLAYRLPMPMRYDLPLVLLSLLVAIGASAGALYTMSRPQARMSYLLVGGLVVGAGIAAMHYIGMAAMRMDAAISYEPLMVLLSLLIAVGAAMAALWLAFQFRADNAASKRLWRLKLAGALVMGIAITGMHYTGIAAARFTPSVGSMAHNDPALDPVPLGIAIVGATLVLLGFTLLAALFDRRFAMQAVALDVSSQRYQSLFEHNSDAVLIYDLGGRLLDANPAALHITGRALADLQSSGLNPLLVAEDAQKMADRMREAAQGKLQEYDLLVDQGAGCTLLLNMRHVPIMINDEVGGIYAIATDITARQRALEALRHNEAALRSMVEQQQTLLQTIQQLSIPVLPVQDHVLLLPLVGNLDAKRNQQLTEVLLSSVERHRASIVIIDITGVPMVDTAVAAHLLQATQAVRLLGAEAILVGITPEVAQTMVQLGVDFNMLTTQSDLQSGVTYALSRQARRNGVKGIGARE